MAATAVAEEQRAWKKQGELARQLMQAREDLSSAEAKHTEETRALMARIPVVSRGVARSAEQQTQSGMMVDVEVAAITDELPRGPKTSTDMKAEEVDDATPKMLTRISKWQKGWS